MASSSLPERNEQLLTIGKQCAEGSCHLVDFLPFKCQHCEQHFCQEHFTVAAHKCPNYDETKHNRVAPNCPLCNQPVAIRPNQNPNARMEEHFAKECSVTVGKSSTKQSPVCGRNKCGKVLFARIQCDKCKGEFCPAHRFPADHSCSSLTTEASAVSSSRLTSSSRLLNLNAKASAAGMATVGAIKKGIATAGSASNAGKAESSVSAASTSSLNFSLFSKTDRFFLHTSSDNNNNHNRNSRDLTTTTTTHPTTDDIKSTPEPIIRPLGSFVPPPIFASA